MVSEPYFQYIVRKDQMQCLRMKNRMKFMTERKGGKGKMMLITRFIGWDYTASNLPKPDSATEVFATL